MKTWLHLLAAVASAGLLAACGGGSDGSGAAPAESSLAEAANAEPSASEFMKLAEAAGTTQRMHADGDMTLIVPSNEAMADMRAEVDELMKPENRKQLQSFVESHLVPKRMLAGDMRTGTETAVSGSGIEVAWPPSCCPAGVAPVRDSSLATAATGFEATAASS